MCVIYLEVVDCVEHRRDVSLDVGENELDDMLLQFGHCAIGTAGT